MWVQYLSSFSVSQETIRRVKQGVALCAPCQSKKSLAWSVLCYCWLLIPDCSRGYRRGYWDRGARSFHQRMSDAGGVDRVWFLFYNRGEKNLRLDTYLSAYSCEISDVGKLLQKKKKIFPVDPLPLGFKNPRLYFRLSSFPLMDSFSWSLSLPLCSFVL